ncbi:hypothetical protein BAUCODRAFT_31647 [Baudoinia panamericana UAMH 10762]|uniref:Uncharacterized protein n=1 Tax=Baudoinia panamericana (strain UAMH 10762) TaxID=717646 RepID=M2MR66_BAUPA|nr:uncharacterized protein BAUCODRAFT_31647 [Baudoinia panamericana UAMH 10762]EMC99331.1 hypothetical protein BAUCODRAFT_31647 [Baudoinia panamericana UAMH 10762]
MEYRTPLLSRCARSSDGYASLSSAACHSTAFRDEAKRRLSSGQWFNESASWQAIIGLHSATSVCMTERNGNSQEALISPPADTSSQCARMPRSTAALPYVARSTPDSSLFEAEKTDEKVNHDGRCLWVSKDSLPIRTPTGAVS